MITRAQISETEVEKNITCIGSNQPENVMSDALLRLPRVRPRAVQLVASNNNRPAFPLAHIKMTIRSKEACSL